MNAAACKPDTPFNLMRAFSPAWGFMFATSGLLLASKCEGDEWHSVHLRAEGSTKIEHFELEQKPDLLHEWVAQLRQRSGGRKVAIAIEQRKGAVIHALMDV
jgi:hypothetical protein